MSGRFITLEGGEGAGKTTQRAALASALRAIGLTVVETREPGGTPGAERIRTLLLDGASDRWDAVTETLLHYAARRDHVEKVIRPALARGDWVVCDRFCDSTFAYQGFGLGLPPAVIAAIDDAALQGFRPELTLVLDIPAEAGLARAHGRDDGATRYERMDIDFHRRLRDGFLRIAAGDPARCKVIPATAPVDEIAAAVRAVVRRRFDLPSL